VPDPIRVNYATAPRGFPDDVGGRLPHDLRMTGPRSASALLVGDAMRPGILACRAETTLPEVARLMASRRVHCIVVRRVVAGSARVEGWDLLSDVDLARAVADSRFDALTAGDVASAAMVTISPQTTLADAARLMCEHGTTHLVVTGRGTGAPVGVLSTLDLAAALAGLESPSLVLTAASY
jgi:CBS domain-containing protein